MWNRTEEKYNEEAAKRFGALNNALPSEVVGQTYGPGNALSEVSKAGKDLAVGDVAGKTMNDLGEKHLERITNKG